MMIFEENIGDQLKQFATELFPFTRSISGDGVRQTLAAIAKHIDLNITEVPTGTAVFDWTVPQEWRVKNAWIKRLNGEVVVDFKKSNLHLVSYSTPINEQMSRQQLVEHLHSLPEQPQWIPYRATHYKPGWGFCMSDKQRQSMTDDKYDVLIDSELFDGSLSYAECFIEGELKEEIVFYTHSCHPSLANDNLSGIAVCTFLAKALQKSKPRFSYRFIFGPGTLGSLSWLSRNQNQLDRIRLGLVTVLLGDQGKFHYKASRAGDHEVDRLLPRVLESRQLDFESLPFSPYGYDERQFCAPGFDLPFGRLTRSANGMYDEYHSSADNLDFIHSDKLAESLRVCADMITMLESNRYWLNQSPLGEPQLGRRGLYDTAGGEKIGQWDMAMLWVLNQADGQHSLSDMVESSGLSIEELEAAAARLSHAGLLTELAERRL